MSGIPCHLCSCHGDVLFPSITAKQLHTVIDLPLQSYQSVYLVALKILFYAYSSLSQLVCSYLENHPSIVAKELLVTFYLKHSQYIDALQVYEKIKSSAWVKTSVCKMHISVL